MNSEITFISNNVKGIQNSIKRIKLFEYLKSYVTGNGFCSTGNALLYKR